MFPACLKRASSRSGRPETKEALFSRDFLWFRRSFEGEAIYFAVVTDAWATPKNRSWRRSVWRSDALRNASFAKGPMYSLPDLLLMSQNMRSKIKLSREEQWKGKESAKGHGKETSHSLSREGHPGEKICPCGLFFKWAGYEARVFVIEWVNACIEYCILWIDIFLLNQFG